MVRLPYRVKRHLPRTILNIVAPSRSPMLQMPFGNLSLESPEFRKTLVVAPHPDDEALGCGGLIAQLARAESNIHVLFVCDGCGSHPGSKAYPPDRLATIRQNEARASLKALGLSPERTTFLAIPDGNAPFATAPTFPSVRAAIQEVISRQSSDSVFMPWRRDTAGDHQAVWQGVRAAASAHATPLRLLEYPIWAWANDEDVPDAGEVIAWRLDITAVRADKRNAIACHRSQLGGLIEDDDKGFRLDNVFLANFDRSFELYFEDVAASHQSMEV